MSELQQHRRAKDQFFGRHPQSPLLPSQRNNFAGLAYFPEDPNLRLTLVLERYDDPQVIGMLTSTGDQEQYRRLGRVQFEVDGQQAQLTVFQGTDGSLFLPFQDATSGSETYGAGRYVDIELVGQDSLLIDFNAAYNPYCAYNDRWRCPMPPRENRLDVAIRAGEKDYPGKSSVRDEPPAQGGHHHGHDHSHGHSHDHGHDHGHHDHHH